MSILVQDSLGRIVDLENYSPDLIDLEEIVLSISNIYRFGAKFGNKYSVLDHTVFATLHSMISGQPYEISKGILCHDLVEGILGFDCPFPIKKAYPQFMELEDSLQEALKEKFSFSLDDPKIRKIDYMMCYWEAAILNPNSSDVLINSDFWPKPEIDILPEILLQISDHCKGRRKDTKAIFWDLASDFHLF
jgi:hypothetical protein